MQDVGAEDEHHHREHGDRRVVPLDEAREPRQPARGPHGLLGAVLRRADRGVDDPLLGHRVALERRDRLAAGHHDHAVAQPLELEGVAGGDDDRHSAGGDLAQDAVDLRARTDVDPLCRLVRDEDRGLGEHRARHHDLLLVPARERRDGRLERRRLDRQLGQLAFDRDDLAVPGSRRGRPSAGRAPSSRCSRARSARPSSPRSAGRPACRPRSRAVRAVRAPCRATLTDPVAGSRPASARRSAGWPLPATPATPTISPCRP